MESEPQKLQNTVVISDHSQLDQDIAEKNVETTLARFVELKFIPEHAATKKSSGRAHFQSILKHVLTPEIVDRAFRTDEGISIGKLRLIPGWPYLDAIRLCDVSPNHIQLIISAALDRGYSTQTATHIRNAIRAIFSHAQTAGYFSGKNPAHQVTLPDMARREAHALTPVQLKEVIYAMRFPEREIALFEILTGMSIAEICGLQWKYVNLSDAHRVVDDEWIPPRTIAVRKQSYRGEFGAVLGGRSRNIPIPDLLSSILRSIRTRQGFTNYEDFVFSSRMGTPISQNNIAARRLKLIGRRLEMPWLSWYVFHRTHVNFNSEFGKQLPVNLSKLLRLETKLAPPWGLSRAQ